MWLILAESDILSDHADGLGSDVQERGDVLFNNAGTTLQQPLVALAGCGGICFAPATFCKAAICSSGTLTGLPLFLNLVAEVAVITNCPRRKTMRTNCFSPSDVIRWPRLCMHQSIGSGDNRTNVAIEFRIRCLWMLGE